MKLSTAQVSQLGGSDADKALMLDAFRRIHTAVAPEQKPEVKVGVAPEITLKI